MTDINVSQCHNPTEFTKTTINHNVFTVLGLTMLSTALNQTTLSNAGIRVNNERKSVCKRPWPNCKVLFFYLVHLKVLRTSATAVDGWSQYLPVLKQSTFRIKPQTLFHHHHHHVPEGLGVLSCSLILKMKLVPPSLPWSSCVSSSFWSIL